MNEILFYHTHCIVGLGKAHRAPETHGLSSRHLKSTDRTHYTESTKGTQST